MRRLSFLLPALTLLTTMIVVPTSASAVAAPRVSVHNDRPNVSTSGSVAFSYHAHHLRSASRVVLQVRRAKQWKAVVRSSKVSGDLTGNLSASAPHKLGSYRYRLVVTRKHKVVARSAIKTVHVYGYVSMNALCHGVLNNYCVSGTNTLDNGSKFHYVMATGVNEPSDPWSAEVGAAKTSCRSVTFTYISDSQDDTNTYLELRQPGHKVQKRTSSSAKVGSFTATLFGGKFGMSVEQDSAQVNMYFNGKASCWSASGKR